MSLTDNELQERTKSIEHYMRTSLLFIRDGNMLEADRNLIAAMTLMKSGYEVYDRARDDAVMDLHKGKCLINGARFHLKGYEVSAPDPGSMVELRITCMVPIR